MFPGDYAFSFDHERFHGHYESRGAALDAAHLALRDHDAPAEAIYVGRRVGVDPQHGGHVDLVLASMRRRMNDASGDANYLRRVNDQQHADLDAALTKTIGEWLRRHDLWPAGERVENISEHPVPLTHAVARSAQRREVGPIGPEA